MCADDEASNLRQALSAGGQDDLMFFVRPEPERGAPASPGMSWQILHATAPNAL
jgi:hypothetical protein